MNIRGHVAVGMLLCCTPLAGCAGRTAPDPSDPPVPMPPPAENQGPGGPSAPAPVQEKGTTIIVEAPEPESSAPRAGDPAPLKALLERTSDIRDGERTAVKHLRPSAIREAATLVTLQAAMSWRYEQLLEAVRRYGAIMDSAFNFAPLMMTQGEALIMPPVLTRAGASMRIEDDDTATTASASFELLRKARYVPVAPHWRTYLMTEGFPKPEEPNPAVLPKNSEEREIWRAAVREAWARGLEEADRLFADNVSRMARDYRGVMLYHTLTAGHLLSRVRTARADLGSRKGGDGRSLHIGQHVYRIIQPSAFIAPADRTAGRRQP